MPVRHLIRTGSGGAKMTESAQPRGPIRKPPSHRGGNTRVPAHNPGALAPVRYAPVTSASGTADGKGMAMSDFDVYQLPEDHEAIRAAVREVCDARVAPHAAEADETGEFPKASYDALRASDFHAPHIPAEYGGAGADALATAIVIEEVARACASSSLIPAVNKLGTMPLILAGSAAVKEKYLTPVAAGAAMFSYCLSAPAAGSAAASMSTRAVRGG